jgi:hypothetical protein
MLWLFIENMDNCNNIVVLQAPTFVVAEDEIVVDTTDNSYVTR